MGSPSRMFGEPQNHSGFQVFVVVFNVGIGMVQYIVLNFPVEYVARQYVDAAPHKFVDPRVFGKRSVIAIVHHIHAHSGHANANNNSQQQFVPIIDIEWE